MLAYLGYLFLLTLGIGVVYIGYIRLSNWKDSYGGPQNLCLFAAGLALLFVAANHLLHLIFPH